MNEKYEYHEELLDFLSRWKRRMTFGPLLYWVGIEMLLKGLAALDIIDEDFSGVHAVFYAIGIIITVLVILSYRKLFIVCNNIKKSYIEIKGNCVCGFAFSKIEENDNGAYCEIPYEQIRNIKIQNPGFKTILDVYNSNNFYTVILDCTNGTYKFCVRNINRIQEQLSEHIKHPNSENIKKATEIPVKPVDLNKSYQLPVKIVKYSNGKTICPICGTQQNDDRYCCLSCGTPFINKQPSIPYWCANCGLPGPFTKNCPKCGSNERIIND